jgi:hypothetical protein
MPHLFAFPFGPSSIAAALACLQIAKRKNNRADRVVALNIFRGFVGCLLHRNN